jgi:hypothetical protein
MTRTWTRAGAVLLATGLVGCASPLHLQYDYGRAYTAAIISQADLTRPSVANSQYPLYGTEAEAIRIRVREKTTDEEDNTQTLEVSN